MITDREGAQMNSDRKLMLVIAMCLLCVMTYSLMANSNELPEKIVKSLFDFTCSKDCTDDDIATWRGTLKFETHDLNGDNIPEFFVYIEHSDWCGAGGNCDYWVYQKNKDDYDLLLIDKVLRVKDTITNGYRDLSSVTPMGFCEQGVQRLSVTPYKYDGEKYQPQPSKSECRTVTSDLQSNT